MGCLILISAKSDKKPSFPVPLHFYSIRLSTSRSNRPLYHPLFSQHLCGVRMATLTALAEEALQQARLLDAYVLAQGRPLTSFDEDTLTNLPPDLVEAREALVNSTHTLKRLAVGPVGVLTEIMWAVCLPPLNHELIPFAFLN